MTEQGSNLNSGGADRKKPRKPGKARAGAKKPTAYFDVEELPDTVMKQVRKLLIEGAPFEDVVEMIAEPGEVTITQRAVEHYFRSKPEVQAARITFQTQAADKLIKDLRSPKSVEAKLARSVLMMGLSGLSRRGEANRVKNAFQTMKDRRDTRFKEADSKRKETKLEFEEQEFQLRVQSLQTKLETATIQLGKLKESIEKHGKGNALGPEIIQQINEIYGLVTTTGPEEMHGDN